MPPICVIREEGKRMEKKEAPAVKKEDDGMIETKYRRSAGSG